MLPAGLLLLGFFAHAIVTSDPEKNRRTNIIALTATLLIVNTTIESFGDYLATAFAAVFALMVSRLIWGFSDPRARAIFQYFCFVSMGYALFASALGFPLTIAVRQVVRAFDLPNSWYLLAPQGTLALCGFAVGAVMGGRILSGRTQDYVAMAPHSVLTGTRDCLIATSVVSVSVVTVNWSSRLSRIEQDAVILVAMVFVYCLILILPQVAYLAYQHARRSDQPLCGSREILATSVLGVASAVLNTFLLRAFLPSSGSAITHFGAVEAPIGLTWGIATGLAFWCVNRLSGSVMATGKPVGSVNATV